MLLDMLSGPQELNPDDCGSEITGIQMVILVSNIHFSPLVMGWCSHWIWAEENMAHLWSPALEFCLRVEQGKWLLWSGFRQGSSLISAVTAMVSWVFQSCSWGGGLALIFPVCDGGKQEHCFPHHVQLFVILFLLSFCTGQQKDTGGDKKSQFLLAYNKE